MKKALLIFLMWFSHITILNAQYTNKDTLYFKWERSYLKVYDVTPELIYLDDGGTDESFYFERLASFSNMCPEKVISLKKYIRTSKYYTHKGKLNDYRFWEHFGNAVLFLVKRKKGKKEYIQVEAHVAVEYCKSVDENNHNA